MFVNDMQQVLELHAFGNDKKTADKVTIITATIGTDYEPAPAKKEQQQRRHKSLGGPSKL